MSTLRERLSEWWPEAHARARDMRVATTIDHVGVVSRSGDGVATVLGLRDTRQGEILEFGDEGAPVLGMAVSLEPEHIGCILFGDDSKVPAGLEVRGTGQVARVPVGSALLGRVVDPLGRALDRPGDSVDSIVGTRHDAIERPAPTLTDRARVSRALATGVLVIDAMLPLGRGQRELIVGDRSTGKTTIAVDTVINQRAGDVICVYALIGQKASTVKSVIDAVRRHGAPERCVFVVAEADSAPGLQWLAPYSACTMAEYFRDRGRDALLVLDDLSKHAVIYRQLSLLLRAPPGREAYPGDIFYIHSRLLERAAQLSDQQGGGSLTALPICETHGGNLTAYIPTNLVSMTDGQIVCQPKLFHEGQKPAVDVGLSVSRVGNKSQAPAMKALAKRLRLEYAQYLELEVFTRFGGMLDAHSRAVIDHGRRIRVMLEQAHYRPLSLAMEVAELLALSEGLFARLSPDELRACKGTLAEYLSRHAGGSLTRINATGELDDDDRDTLIEVIRRFVVDWERDRDRDRQRGAVVERAPGQTPGQPGEPGQPGQTPGQPGQPAGVPDEMPDAPDKTAGEPDETAGNTAGETPRIEEG